MAAVHDVGGGPGATRLDVGAAAPGRRQRARVPVLALGMLSLLGALAGGLARLGWGWPVPSSLVAFHGPLMVSGFLGTVIALERAVALGRHWAYAAPAACGLGALALAAGAPGGAWLMTLGSVVTVVIFAALLRRQMAPFTVVIALGTIAWVVGQTAWVLGAPVHRMLPWWAGFLVLTIAGERLELTRLVRLGASARAAFLVAVGVLVAGLVLAWPQPDHGMRLTGAAWIALAAWLGTFDIARRTARMPGLPRFIALALLAGYGWLGVAGVLAVSSGAVAAGPPYDAIVHALFVGFAFSMIFGHAPIIFPAVLGVGIPYRPSFYVHLGLLHGSLALRILADLAGWDAGRRWGGLVNALAILLFLASTAASALGSRRGRAAPAGS